MTEATLVIHIIGRQLLPQTVFLYHIHKIKSIQVYQALYGSLKELCHEIQRN